MEQLRLFNNTAQPDPLEEDLSIVSSTTACPESRVSTAEKAHPGHSDEQGDPSASERTAGDNSGWTLIHQYTRAQALEDGLLVDVSDTAREVGMIWPVALTTEVWRLIEQIPDQHSHEDVWGRLWDVLWMLRCAIKPPRGYERLIKRDDIVVREDDVEIHYRVIVHHKETASSDGEIVLKAVSGPGDHGEPVLTIMRTYES
jgi:hypothetical protein